MTSNFPVTASVGADLAGALQSDVKVNITANNAGKQFIKYGTYSGEWFIGKGNTDITGEIVLINTQSIGHGWQLWVNSRLEKQSFVPFVTDLPLAPEAMRNKKNQLEEAREARIIGGSYEGDEDTMNFEFTGTSYGIRQAVDTLLNEIRAKSIETSEFLYPEVKLTCAEPYENTNKKGEFIYNPMFEVVGWCNQDGELEGEKAEKIEAKPKPKSRAKAKAAAEEVEAEKVEEPEAEATPVRRRRRN